MAEEQQGTPVEIGSPKEDPEIVVEVQPDESSAKPLLSDEEVENLAGQAPSEDQVSLYAKDAQKRIKAMHTANQEWRKRVLRSNNDLAAATNLAQQLYNENQQLRHSNSRNETALVEQAIQRADAMLATAEQNLRSARQAGDIDLETKAAKEIARYVAEGDRLRLLKPSSAADGDRPPAAASGPAPTPGQPAARTQVPQVTQATAAWVARNPWFEDSKEKAMRRYAMGIHNELVSQGITEQSDPQGYFGAIDREMRAQFPDKFKNADPAPAANGAAERPAAGAPSP
jgi:hypothetical protein